MTTASVDCTTSKEQTAKTPPADAETKSKLLPCLHYVCLFRKTLIIVFAPLILALMFCIVSPKRKDMRCLYVVLVMATYWISEVLPLAVTALLPLVLYPTFGVMKSGDVASNYLKDSLFLFCGGYFIAIALEKCMLHKRIALGTLLIVGSNPKNILFAIMCCTSFLSLWISNGAATGMMLPIIQAILIELIKGGRRQALVPNQDGHQSQQEVKLSPETLLPDELNLCKMLYLASCYASSIGGIGTLTGTPPNVIVYGFVENRYGSETSLSYVTWMLFGVPQAVVGAVLCWIVLVVYFKGFRGLCAKPDGKSDVKEVIRKQYLEMGKMSYQERNVAGLFILLVLIWIMQNPRVIPGWASLFEKGYVSNTAPAILAAILLFILPAEAPDWTYDGNKRKVQQAIMNWKYLQSKFPWEMLLLIGGSFAMAAGIDKSGLSKLIGDNLSKLSSLSPFALCVVATVLASTLTEFTTNAAAATILTPVLMAVAEQLRINPLYLVMPAGFAVSYAFMLPIGTPANAMVFSLGILRVVDMVKVGFFVNIVTALVTIAATNTLGVALFGGQKTPSWLLTNATVTHTSTLKNLLVDVMNNTN